MYGCHLWKDYSVVALCYSLQTVTLHREIFKKMTVHFPFSRLLLLLLLLLLALFLARFYCLFYSKQGYAKTTTLIFMKLSCSL